MIPFFEHMADNPFLVRGLLAGLLASVACGLVGPYVVTRRIVFLSGAIAHMAVGGIGAAIFLAAQYPAAFDWLTPLHGATAAALAAAVLIGIIHQRVSERMDTLIGALWAIGMALGIMLIKFTPGYQTQLMSYLFGNISYVSWGHLQLLAALCAIILVAVLLFHKRLLTLCLDEQQLQMQGVNVLATNIILLCLVALTVIALTQVVGLILVIALLSLPAATAAHHFTRLSSTMAAATALCLFITTVPRIAVYGRPVSAESAIVLAAGAVYLLSVAWKRLAWRGVTPRKT